MKIKVIHVLGSFHFGGIEKLVSELIKIQKESETLEPRILVIRADGEFTSRFVDLGIPIIAINPKYTYRFSFKQIQLVSTAFHSADIIHFHGFHLYIAFIGILTRKKIIYTEHGNFGFGRKLRLSDKVNHKVRKYFLKYFASIVACNSVFTKELLELKWKLKGPKFKVVYNGAEINNEVDYEEVKRIRNCYDNRFIIGTISRLASVKEIPRLVQAFKDFLKNHPESILLIVGEGSERGRIEKAAGDLLNRNIFLVGFKLDVHNYFNAIDITVFPSKNESFGLVAIEAYSAGRPVVVFSDGGGLTEIVKLCNPKDIVSSIQELVDRMDYYHKHREGKLDYSNFLEYFSLRRMAWDYTKCYKELQCVE